MILRLGVPLSGWKSKWRWLTPESRYWISAWSLAQTIRDFQPRLPEPQREEANHP